MNRALFLITIIVFFEMSVLADPVASERQTVIDREVTRLVERSKSDYRPREVKEFCSEAIKESGRNKSGWMFRLRDLEAIMGNKFDTKNPLAYQYKQTTGEQLTGVDALTSIIHFDRELKKRGTDLIVVPVPNSTQVYGYLAHAGISRDDLIWPAYTDALLTLLRHDVEVIDLLDDYKRVPQGEEVLFRLDHHWTSRGIDLAAARISERLDRYTNLLREKEFKLQRSTTSVRTPNYMLVLNKVLSFNRAKKTPSDPNGTNLRVF